MIGKTALGLAALASLAAAETHVVWVAQGGLTIEPDTIPAAVGDEVEFRFASSGHDIAQGPFNEPCRPSDTGFYSGSVPQDGSFTVTIEDTNPKWVYCSVAQHCASGMVAVINPPQNGPNTIDAYRSAASEAGAGQRPDEMRGGELGSGDDESESGDGGYDYPSPTESWTPSGTATPDAASNLLAKESVLLSAVFGALAIAGGWFGLL